MNAGRLNNRMDKMTPLEFLRLRNSGDCSEELLLLRERNREREALRKAEQKEDGNRE